MKPACNYTCVDAGLIGVIRKKNCVTINMRNFSMVIFAIYDKVNDSIIWLDSNRTEVRIKLGRCTLHRK